LDAARWQAVVDGLDSTAVALAMPKFTLEYELEMNDVLTALGMGVAFTGNANFSKMRAANDLYIDKVKHKTFVDVNEEGTEAAAVTSVATGGIVSVGSSRFLVDRPFVFAIRERYSGAILFIGKILDPEG
jgi:serine protease inhibitor